MKISHAIAATGALLFAGTVFAGPQCTDAPKSQWMSQDAMKQQLKADGYTVDRFKVTDGNCYEIYGEEADGVKVEIYHNPVDGEVVKQRRND